jgi:hypothetical protein
MLRPGGFTCWTSPSRACPRAIPSPTVGAACGQAKGWPGVPCHGDVFHGLRELTRLSATLERRAYTAIAQRDALEQQMDQAKHHRPGRALSQRLARARIQEASALRLADEVHTLTHWMRATTSSPWPARTPPPARPSMTL